MHFTDECQTSADARTSGLSPKFVSVVRADCLSDRSAEPGGTFEHVVEGEREELREKMPKSCNEFMGNTTRVKERGNSQDIFENSSQTFPSVIIPTLAEDLLPEYASEYAAGADVRAFLKESIIILSGHSALVPTGLYFEIPNGYEMQVRPRSGLALKNQITVLNSPGTIDSDYRGELKIILINHGNEPFEVLPNMRIAQIVIAPVIRAYFVKASTLSTSQRGVGGFGHTGVH